MALGILLILQLSLDPSLRYPDTDPKPCGDSTMPLCAQDTVIIFVSYLYKFKKVA